MKLKIETADRGTGTHPYRWCAWAKANKAAVLVRAFGRTEREAKRRLLQKLVTLSHAAWGAACDLGDELEGAKR